ncbi:MAG: hypothetical protein EDQ89_03970 [Acidobacteria bacterium]|nr:MAG: hypothetical protein EDQ89_03970 [Acidobacteriota bacterium]GIK77742.1 MAG: hypothetical protein BroJett022_14320 [Actinomycetes bacterium]
MKGGRRLAARLALPLPALTLAGLALAGPAWGHAAFLESEPAPGANLKRAPLEVKLEFTEPLNERLTGVELLDEQERPAPAQIELTGRDGVIVRPNDRLPGGVYTVSWYTVSTLDGHPLEGTFEFGVRADAENAQSIEQSPLLGWGWLRITSRAVFYAALFFFAGGVFTATLLSPRRLSGWLLPERIAESGADRIRRARRGARRRTLGAGWVATAGALAVALVETLDATGGLSPGDLGDFLLGNAAGLARIWTVALLALASSLIVRAPRGAAVAVASSLLAIALGGHASSASPQTLAVLSDWVHLLAGAIWVGGLTQIAATWIPLARRTEIQVRRQAMRLVLARFGRIALPAFAVVALTGALNSLIQLESPAALWQTSYGRVLAVKLGLVGTIAFASYLHALHLRPRLLSTDADQPAAERRHWRLLAVEPALAIGVVAAAAALVAFPLPPRDLPEGEAAAAPPCEPCPVPKPRRSQLAVAENIGSNIAALWVDSRGRATLRTYGVDGAPARLEAEPLAGLALGGCGNACRRLRAPPGRMTIAASIAGDRFVATMPTAWNPDKNRHAEQLAVRAQETMRALRSVRVQERTTSGPGTLGTADARLIADRQPRLYRQVFRWGRFAATARWLGTEPRRGGGAVRLAVLDPGAPTWFRLLVDVRTGRVLTERLITTAHFIDRRYSEFER